MPTYRVLVGETHAQYYEVVARDEDQAMERAYNWDEDQRWAIDTWDEGVVDQNHADTEEVA